MDQDVVKILNRTYFLFAIVVLGLLAFFVEQVNYQNQSLEQQNTNQIIVSGEGKIYAKPDVALVSLGVTANGATVDDVTKSGTDKMNAVIAAVKKLGVADKDIQTTNYNLNPVYSNIVVPLPAVAPGAVYSMPILPVQSSSKLTGYTLDQDVQVKIRDFTKIGNVLSQATSAGANLVGDLQFTIDNPEQFKEQARAEAIVQAKSNAANLAKESGINLGKLINVSENSNPFPIMYSNAMAVNGSAMPSATVPTVQPGQQEIDVAVNLTYQVK